MVRVDWEQEAEEAQKHSIARQADRLLQHPSNDLTDVENMLDGIPEESTLPGECISVACSHLHNAESNEWALPETSPWVLYGLTPMLLIWLYLWQCLLYIFRIDGDKCSFCF